MFSYISSKLENPDFPLLGPNLNALKFWGLLLPDNRFKRFLYIFLHFTVIVFTATEYAEIWFVKYDMNLTLTNLKITLLATVSVSKVTSFLIRQKHWKDIIDYVNRADKVQRGDSEVKDTIINKYTSYSRKITYFYWILMYTTVIIVMSQPIFKYILSENYRNNIKNGTEDYAQVVSSWVPFDKNSPIGHIFACIYQSYAAIYGGGWITSFDTNAIAIMVFFKGELEMLKIDSSNVCRSENLVEDRKGFYDKFKNCHNRHVELIKVEAPFTETAYRVKYFKPIPKEINQDVSTVWTYVKLFDSCLSPIMLLYVIVCSVMLCATAYQLTVETNAMQKFITAEYLIFGVSQLFMFCWHSNEVLYVSKDLSLGPYESMWWTRSVSEQKDISILTDQFNKEIVFSAGPFTNITVATFISILKGAYSYYTLLSQSEED